MLKPGVPPRRHDLDALRVLATAAVFLFHCAKLFDPDGFLLGLKWRTRAAPRPTPARSAAPAA